MPENNSTDKLVGTQYLDLTTLKRNVDEANALIASIGKNVNIDFSKQIKASFDSVFNEIKTKIKEIKANVSAVNNAMSISTPTFVSSGDSTGILDTTKIRSYIDEHGNLARTIIEGMDAAGNHIQQTIEDGKLLSTVISQTGEEAKLWTQIEKEQNEARAEEAKLWTQIKQEQKSAQEEEKRLMKELMEEQKQYIKEQEKIAKLEEQRAQRAATNDYAMLFDKIQQSEVDQYVTSLDRQIQLTKELYELKTKMARTGSSGYESQIQEIQDQLSGEKQITDALSEQNKTLTSNSAVKAKIKELTQEQKKGEKEVTQAQKERGKEQKNLSKISDQIVRSLTHMATMWVMNGLKSFWNSAQDYVKEYYDLLNEIRIVTGLNEDQANALGQSYRQLAADMSVSSVDVASAAVEFWRQGLSENEVNERLISTTRYAKISGLEFREAAELVTAATNSMGLSADKIVDVYAYLGDASASGADEIGKAMQRVAASAEEAGISFEWLGAYIATVSEQTRLAPELIGRSFNSLISRLQSIKQKGYSSEDATKINDVAKALSNIDVALMDQEGNWRSMTDIFNDVAAVWGTLDDKTRSYIATTMAGTTQKNVFLTLMNDLSKMNETTGEGSRAMELYYGAMTASGQASEKYAIYQQSVEAAQAKLNLAFEEFYSLLGADVLKGFYNTMAGLVSSIANGTNAVTVLTGAVAGQGVAVLALKQAFIVQKRADQGLNLITFLMSGGKVKIAIAAIVAGIAALTAAVGYFVKKYKSANEGYDYSGALESINNRIANTTALRDEYEALAKVENRSEQQNQRMAQIVDTLAGSNDRLKGSLDSVNGGWQNTSEVLKAVNSELNTYQKTAKQLADAQFMQAMAEGADQARAQEDYHLTGNLNIFRDYLLGFQGKEKTVLFQSGDYDLYDVDDVGYLFSSFTDYREGDYLSFGLTKEDAKSIKKYVKGYGGDYVKMVVDLVNGLSTEESGDALREAWKDFVYSCFEPLAYDDTYSGLNPMVQQYIQQAALGFLDGFTIEELADPEQRFNIQQQLMDYIDSLFDPTGVGSEFVQLSLAFDNYTKLLSDPDIDVDWLNNTKDGINGLISTINTKYGTSIPFVDDLVTISQQAENTEEDQETLESRQASTYESLAEGAQKNAVKKRSEAGWDTELSDIETALTSGDLSVVEDMVRMFTSEENSAFFEQMKDDLLFINDLFMQLIDETGSFTIDPTSVNAALVILQEGLDETQKKTQALKESLQSSMIAQELEDLKESNFASWFKEMLEFAEGEDEQGLFDWLIGKDEKQIDAFIEAYPVFAEFINSIVESKGAVDEIAESWTAFAGNITEATNTYLAWVKAYQESQKEKDVTDEEGHGLLKNQRNAYDKGGIDEYKKAFEEMTDAQRDWVMDNSKGAKEMYDIMEDTTDATKDTASAMKKLRREVGQLDLDDMVDAGDVWKEMPDIMDDAAKGGQDFAETYSEAVTKVEELSEAQGALAAIQSGTLTSTEDIKEAYETLASYTGLSAESLKNDLSPAIWMLNNDTALAGNSVAYLANWLATTTGIQFSASNWQSQLSALSDDADNTTAHVATLVNALLKAAGASLYMDNDTVKVKWGVGNFTPTSKKSGGGGRSSGGGGGGGSSSSSASKEMSEIEKMLDMMEQIQKIRDHQMDMIDEARSYYETTGELQGVIKYYEKERDAVQDNNKVLEENIRKIETLMFAKQKEVAAMDTSDEAYEQAAKDLEGLQDAHQEYTLQLMENKTKVEDLTQSIKEQYDEIRDKEIELRDTIMEAIEDREELNERMLQGRIDVENEILDIITRRYEKERDEILETMDARREALEQEKDQLDEQLEARRNASEQEDKRLKLAQLQAQLERISADPTRKKEELELRKEIAELRDEMAWDLAEEEVEAQKDAIDQQITSLDDYIEYVESYYEDLFEHPQKLIEEMKNIISKTDEEILAFLKENSEEYAASTEATQQSMVNSWNEMLMDMHGSIETYWDEVEQIIAGGDDAIIEFLKQNSADYKAAGQLQAEAYVDEWKQQLEDLRKAHKEVTDEINNTTYTVVRPSTGGGSSSGGSGGGGGGGSSNSTGTDALRDALANGHTLGSMVNWQSTNGLANSMVNQGSQSSQTSQTSSENWGYQLTQYSKKYGDPVTGFSTKAEAQAAAKAAVRTLAGGKYTVKKYLEGGLADFTGFAWLDGSKTNPERILSPYQTTLFEDLISTLHGIKVSTSSMPSIAFDGTGGGQNITFGDIVINVEKLDEDQDYANVAEQVMEQIMDAMSRGQAVGGIRITR